MVKSESPKKVKMDVSMDDWGAAIQEALRPVAGSVGGKTVAEIAAETGRGINLVRKTLRKEMVRGTLDVRAERRLAIDGTWRTSPAYRLKAAK